MREIEVKSDHRSKFSNLSIWKEEAWKLPGLQRDSNPWPPRYQWDDRDFQTLVSASGHTHNICSPTGCKTAAEEVDKPLPAIVAEAVR